MDYSLMTRLAAEMIGTALLIVLGNGAVANVDLKGTKGYGSDWMLIAVGYGFGVMMPAMIFGGISGNHINPAFTIALASNGLFPWAIDRSSLLQTLLRPNRRREPCVRYILNNQQRWF